MAIDPRISLGVQQLQLNDPLTQYGQVQNILAAQAQQRAAGTQNELAQAQLGQTRMTIRQVQEAHDFVNKTMEAAAQNNAPTKDPMETALTFIRHSNPNVNAVGEHMLKNLKLIQEYEAQVRYTKDQEGIAPTGQPAAVAPAAPQYAESPAFGATGREIPEGPNAAVSTPVVRGMPNALAPAAAPQVNALAAPQGKTAESLATKINDGDRRYGTTPGWLKQRELLVKEFDQLIKPEFEFREVPNADGTIGYQAINKRTAQAQPVMSATNQPVTGPNVPAQKLAFEKEVEQYKRDNPSKTVHTIINDDGTTSMLAVDNKTGVATKVTLGGVEVKGVDTAAQKFEWEKANPTKEIKEVTDINGATKFVAIDKQAGTATQVTMSGADLSGVNTAAQRLAWEKANPTKEIKEVPLADGTTKLMAVDKQTGVATPVTSEGKPLVGAKYVTPSEEEKLIKLRDSLPKGSADYNAVNAKVNQAAEQNRIAKANLAIVTRRLNEELAADKGLSDKSIELAANLYLINGTLPPLGSGAKAASAKKQIIDRAAELSGTDSAAAARNIVESKQDVAGQTAAVKDFSSGMSARRVTANNTALNHLETMDKLAGDLNNSDIRIVNAAGNAFARATGSAAPTNFDSAKQLVAAEVIKAVVQNGGGVTERQEAADNIKSASSPEQLRQIIQTYRELLGGQLSSLAQQYETGTGRKDFDKKLSPATRELLKKSTPAPANKTNSGATVSNW